MFDIMGFVANVENTEQKLRRKTARQDSMFSLLQHNSPVSNSMFWCSSCILLVNALCLRSIWTMCFYCVSGFRRKKNRKKRRTPLKPQTEQRNSKWGMPAVPQGNGQSDLSKSFIVLHSLNPNHSLIWTDVRLSAFHNTWAVTHNLETD